MDEDAERERARRARAGKDREFLGELHRAPPMPFDALAEKVGQGAAAERSRGIGDRITQLVGQPREGERPRHVLRLEDEGAIVGYRAVVDARRLDLEQTGFVQVALRDLSPATLDAFAAAVRDLGQVEACHMIAGEFHYILRTRTTSVAGFRTLLTRHIATLPGVVRTAATLAMETVKGD